MQKVPVEKEIAATQTMSACADCLKTLALRVRVCIASDFDAVGNLQLWDAPVLMSTIPFKGFKQSLLKAGSLFCV